MEALVPFTCMDLLKISSSKILLLFPFAAGFSAFGAACAEYMHRYNKGTRIIIPANAKEELLVQIANDIAEAWKALQKEAIHEMDDRGNKTRRSQI